MSGSVKLDCYEKLTALVDGEAISADYSSSAIDMRRPVRSIIRLEWSGYDGTNGKAYLQLSDDPHTTDLEWDRWGSVSNASATMSSATGSCIFHIWQAAPGYVRARFEIGDGTAANITVTYRLKFG